jgi:hypothetical protein
MATLIRYNGNLTWLPWQPLLVTMATVIGHHGNLYWGPFFPYDLTKHGTTAQLFFYKFGLSFHANFANSGKKLIFFQFFFI